MRIAFVHSFYSSRQPSGENLVVKSEVAALRKAGHEVELFAAHTDQLQNDRLYPLRAAYRVATGRGANPLQAIRHFSPDIVHVHNLFPNFGGRWVEDIDVPVVHTVHNYRPLCANGLLFRDGSICTDCPAGKRWSGIRHACYRSSRFATLPSAWANRNGPMADPLFQRADRIFMLTENQQNLYVDAGVPKAKTVVSPNFLPEELDPGSPGDIDRNGWLFVGRLSEEKGIHRLLERWPTSQSLQIVGDGPLRSAVEAQALHLPYVHTLGALTRAKTLQYMQRSRALIFPSLWLEALPLVYLEALACDLPVLAFEPTTVAEIVLLDGAGATITWTDDLVQALNTSDFSSCAPRHAFSAQYSEQVYVERITGLYQSVALT